MQTITLSRGTTALKSCKRGYLITDIGEFTVTMFYIPRSNTLKITTIGANVTVTFGKTWKITMPDDMWADYQENIIAAAMGEDVTS